MATSPHIIGKTSDRLTRREALKEAGKTALGLGGAVSLLAFMTYKLRNALEGEPNQGLRERLEQPTLLWDAFQEAGVQLLEEDPDFERQCATLRWRELQAPSVFHTVVGGIGDRLKGELQRGEAFRADNIFRRAAEGDATALVELMKKEILVELKHPEIYADAPASPPADAAQQCENMGCCEQIQLPEHLRKPQRRTQTPKQEATVTAA